MMQFPDSAEILQRQDETISNLKEVKVSPITRNLPSSSRNTHLGQNLNFVP
jgi:hypothetical protein